MALMGRVASLGYEAAECSPEHVATRLSSGVTPAAIVVCTGAANPATLMAELRRTRHGAAVPVTLCGRPGGPIRDLADVLDLGADHFLEEPVPDEQLASALEALAGPPPRTISMGAGPRRPEAAAAQGDWPNRTEVLSDSDDSVARGATGSIGRTGSGGDPAIGQLHRTLDLLEERLRTKRDPTGSEVGSEVSDELERSLLKLDPVPIGAEGDAIDPADSQGGLEIVARPDDANPPDATVLLEATAVTTRPLREGSDPGSHRSAAAPIALDEVHDPESSSRLRDRPRRTPPLPVDREGQLEQLEVPRLLWKLSRAGFTGTVTLARGRVEKRLWFQAGNLGFARSNLGHDRLTDGLLRRGLLTRTQYDAARRLAAKEPRRAGQLLVEAGFLKPDELPRVLREHLIRIIDSTFAWTEGRWWIVPGERCDEPLLLDRSTAQILLEGVRARMDAAQLWALVGGPRQFARLEREVVEGGFGRLADELGLTPSEESLLARLDGRHSLEDLIAEPPVDELELLDLVYALHVLELVDLTGERQAQPKVEVERSQVDRARIGARLELAREGDYFALLGLSRDAGRVEVRRARAELVQTFADHELESATRRDLADELQELRVAIDEAARILADDGLRSAYLAHLEEP